MSRIQIITLGIVFLGLFHWVSSVAIGEGKPPNLILILADDVSADELSPYGGDISMPNLQKLADDGVLFRNSWATPVCAPSRAMLMTGKYPHHTGYYENPVAPEVPFWTKPGCQYQETPYMSWRWGDQWF